MPFPLIILGALALAGGGAYYAFSGARGGPLAGSPAPAGRFSAAGPGRAAKPPAKPQKKFKAPLEATSREKPVYAGSDLVMAGLAIQKCMQNSRNAEDNYDTLKNTEGWGAVTEIASTLGTLKKVYDNPLEAGSLADLKGKSSPSAAVPPPKSLSDIGRWHRQAKGYFYNIHEASLKQAVAFAGSQFIVTKTVHRGEEFAWSHAVIVGPGVFETA